MSAALQTLEQRCATWSSRISSIEMCRRYRRMIGTAHHTVLRPDSTNAIRGRELQGRAIPRDQKDEWSRSFSRKWCETDPGTADSVRRHRRQWRASHLGRQKSEKINGLNVLELKDKTVNVPAVGGTEVENILGAAQEDAGFEKLLKFKKGEYFIGEELVPLGTEFIAHAIGWTKCWIKFVDDEVVERKVYRVALGERPPEREDLRRSRKGQLAGGH